MKEKGYQRFDWAEKKLEVMVVVRWKMLEEQQKGKHLEERLKPSLYESSSQQKQQQQNVL